MHPTQPPPPDETRDVAAFERTIHERGEWSARLENAYAALRMLLTRNVPAR
jgi:hypothetical protein